MDIFFWNTLGRTKHLFTPVSDKHVGMYTCGPTVYDRASIGNLRSYVFADVVRRLLEAQEYDVTQVVNITDVGHLVGDGDAGEDKLEVGAKREGQSAWDIAKKYTELFVDDTAKMNIEKPSVMPRATDHIPEQIALVLKLEKNGHTYVTKDGVYFDTTTLEDYGKLSGQNQEEKEGGARVAVGEKRHPADFALWKFSPEGEKRQMEWDSPWGKGFPGWHVECSAMSEKYLGVPFDIHTGGVDHIAVHHENEIAQTEGATGALLANVWMHNEFLTVDGGKMSKSLGNTYSLDDLAKHGISPLGFRFFLLGAHYRTQLNFTFDAALASETAYRNLCDKLRELPKPSHKDDTLWEQFLLIINDDVNTPSALAELWNVVNDDALDGSVKAATVLAFDEVLGLALEDVVARPVVVPRTVQKLLDAREKAREQKDFAASDKLRDDIRAQGFLVDDGASGQRVRKAR